MTGALRAFNGLGVSDHLRLMPPVDRIKSMKYLIPLFNQIPSYTVKTNLSEIFVTAQKEVWPDLHVMIGSLFEQTEDNLLLREEITQLLANVLSKEFYTQGNRIPYLGGPEEHSLFYKLITE